MTLQIAFAIWLTGAAFVAYTIARQVRCQRAVLRISTLPSAQLRRLIEGVSAGLGLSAPPVRVSRLVTSPFVSCLIRPTLVWPESLADDASLATCRGVVAHELAHIRRRDHWIVRLEALAATLWWWNPVFWLIRKRLDEARELACDAIALESTPSDRRALAELLLTFSAAPRPAPHFAPLRTGIAPRHPFRRRLAMLFDDSVTPRLSPPGLALAGLLAAATLPGWAWSQEEPPQPIQSADPAAVATPTAPAAEPAAPTSQPPSSDAFATPAAPAAPADPSAPGFVTPPSNPLARPADPETAPPASEPPVATAAPAALPRNDPSKLAPADAPALPAAAQSLPPGARVAMFDDGKFVVLQPAADGRGVILRLFEKGQQGDGTTYHYYDLSLRPAERLRLLYFTADWSAPDRRMTPTIEKLQKEGFPIEIVDADRSRELLKEHHVTSIPAVVAVIGDREAGRLVGSQDEPALRRFLTNLSASPSRREPATFELSAPLPVPTPAIPQASGPAPVRSPAEIKLLENALELANLEVEEKRILLDRGRADAERQQKLFESGVTAEPPRDLRLFEIELKKAELRARQARIELEAAQTVGALQSR